MRICKNEGKSQFANSFLYIDFCLVRVRAHVRTSICRLKEKSSDLLHNDSSFAGFTLNGELKQGSIFSQCLSKDLEDAAKEQLDRIYIQNEDENFHHNMERLS